MKKLAYLFLVLLLVLFTYACGDSSGGDSDSGGTETGTVVVEGRTGTGSPSGSISALQTAALADSVLIRPYSVCLAASNDCDSVADDEWDCVFDETDDTSDCVTNPTATSDFEDLTGNPQIASNSSFEAGTRDCVRVVMCDQLLWSANLLVDSNGNALCPGTNVLDVAGDDAEEAQVATYYWSTSGSNGDGENKGQADNPFLLSDPVTIAAGETTTIIVSLSNLSDVEDFIEEEDPADGMYARYTDESDWGIDCDVPAPDMSVTEE